jgi:hypothetical protein
LLKENIVTTNHQPVQTALEQNSTASLQKINIRHLIQRRWKIAWPGWKHNLGHPSHTSHKIPSPQ